MNLKSWSLYLFFPVLLLGIFYGGYTVGAREVATPQEVFASLSEADQSRALEDADFAPFWRAWSVINEKYIADEEVSSQEKVWGSIDGLARSLGDPYTRFFPPEEAEQFQNSIRGQFGGVGMEVGLRDEVLTVVAPLPGTPAAEAGVETGDQILEIDGTTTRGMSVDEAVSLIRGEEGTIVTLTVERESRDEPFEIEIERDIIDVPSIETEDLAGDVFKINVYQFSATAPESFRQALREFRESGNTQLVLDLRGNPGGYLEAAVDMSSWFLSSGEVVVREQREGEDDEVYRSKGYNIFDDDLEMVILVNGGTASASEIMAAALSENGIATLVGTQTFGKGSVQEVIEITPETALKVTVAKWITPNGVSFSEQGLEPDVVVEADQEQFLAGEDPQLDRALEILAN